MPNHITTVITFHSEEDFHRVYSALAMNEHDLDFNKVIPQPKSYSEYDTEAYPFGKDLEKLIGERNPDQFRQRYCEIVNQDLIEDYRRVSEEQQREYRVVGWYNWRRKYWGTKWNAYEVTWDRDTLEVWFDTAWNVPVPILRALSEKFPDISFDVISADEDASYNTFIGMGVNGTLLCSNPVDGSPEAWEIYFNTHPIQEEYYVRQPDGTYLPLEED